MLSLPTLQALWRMRDSRVIECGAGNGTWLRLMRQFGECQNAPIAKSVGIDPSPDRGGGVLPGDHRTLKQYKNCDLLLIVWPPDRTIVADWVKYWPGKRVAICGSFERFIMPDLDVEYEEQMGPGVKGGNRFVIGTILK